MTLLKSLGTGLCLTVLCLLTVPKAKADDWNRKTVITFSGPVEVPGVGVHLLPAGTYVFKILQSAGNLHIVQISNQDETHVFTTVLAIANFRLKTTDKTVITFSERPAGEPEALKAWFYPGRELGEQFVYEEPRAIELAKETNEIVLSTPTVFATTPVESLSTVPIQAVNPAGERVDTALVVEAPPAAVVVDAPVAVATAEPVAPLPKTASNLGLIGLSGMMLLGAGLLVSGLLKKSV
jgi:hypothetical protein